MVQLSVILPCHSVADRIADQLQALANQTYRGQWELVVVDNRCEGAAREVVESFGHAVPSLRIVRADGRSGVAYARNVGVRASSGSLLLFCDSDDVVDRDWLNALAHAVERDDFVGGRREMSKLNEPWVQRSRRWSQQHGVQEWDTPPYWKHIGGGNMGMKRWFYDRVGPFDEALDRLSDTDYCFRAQQMGYQPRFSPEAVVHVRMRSSLKGIHQQGRGWGEASVALHKKFVRLGMARPSALRPIGGWMLAFPRLLLVRDKGDLAAWLFGMGWRVGRLRGTARHRFLAL